MHASQHDSTGVLHPSGMLHPDPYSRPCHPITWSGGLASSVTTALRIVAMQGPSRGTPAATSVARGERREPAADALRDLVPGDLQHLASRDSQGLQTLRLSGSTITPRVLAAGCLLRRSPGDLHLNPLARVLGSAAADDADVAYGES
ncbi:MAG: hypothetical protein GY814_12980 [Gammaproteobacteria bacterium]|nr:hypothetical protein [Gammaproteobacteria bacterium]